MRVMPRRGMRAACGERCSLTIRRIGGLTMAERDPYAECVCTHGRHTHVRYTGACGLCDCAVVRPAPIPESGDPSSAYNEQEQ